MTSFRSYRRTLAGAILCAPLLVHAQGLTLFEPVEGGGATPEANAPSPFAGPTNGQPIFTLRSTSRIGDRYNVVLVHREGQVAKVQWVPGQNVEVPGFGGFAISDVRGRTVALSLPDSCVSAPDRGVSCETESLARLSLTSAAPAIAQAVAAPSQQDPFAAAAAAAALGGASAMPLGVRGPAPAGPTQAGQGETVVINPFTGQPEVVPQASPQEQELRDQRQRARSERLGRFTPQRIDDAEVPEGMQKVSTPFGDTLVPIQ